MYVVFLRKLIIALTSLLSSSLLFCFPVDPFPCGFRTSLLQGMVCDPYANYVVQKIIDVADQEQRQTIILEIKTHAAQLKRWALIFFNSTPFSCSIDILVKIGYMKC